MKNRYMPFGYRLCDGEIVINDAEVKTILRVFTLYEQGESLQTIAELLKAEGVPYCGGLPRWNLNSVSRILRNEKYLGTNKFLKLMDPERFQKVQAIYRAKSDHWASNSKDLSSALWEKLACHECGGRITRIGGKLARKGIVQLRCMNPGCDNGLDIPVAELYLRIWEAMRNPIDVTKPTPKQEYQPSAEVFRIRNEVDRLIQSPGHPAEARRLILKGIAARYECIQDEALPPKLINEESDRSAEIDWKLFSGAVSYISIGKDCSIHVGYNKENVSTRTGRKGVTRGTNTADTETGKIHPA